MPDNGPAFPIENAQLTDHWGLSKHQFVATMILQGFAGRYGSSISEADKQQIVDTAFELAGKLLSKY